MVDPQNPRVQVFDSNGRFLLKWGSEGADDGQFDNPLGIAVDGAGNVYVADFNHRVQVFDGNGRFLLKWGTEGNGNGQFNAPWGIALDGAGNVYVADTGNDRVQVFDPVTPAAAPTPVATPSPTPVALVAAGNISTVAGNGTSGFSGDGGPATSAQLVSPIRVAVDSSGNLFIADTSNHRIRKVGSSGNISTVAGNGTRGFSGDGGPATSAQLNFP